MDPNSKLPDFFDKGTTQSFKETFCAAVLLWVARRVPRAVSPAPTPFRSATRKVALVVIVYVTARHDPSQLMRQALP
jgi:hypothetical protein